MGEQREQVRSGVAGHPAAAPDRYHL